MNSSSAAAADPRYEAKLVLPATSRHVVDAWLRVHRANFAPAHEPRWVNNIYFDTEEGAALNEAVDGQARRMKVRLRWYGEQSSFECAMLEFKCKSGSVGWKRLCPIERSFNLKSQTWRGVVRLIRAAAPIQQRVFFDQTCRPALLNRYRREYYLSFDQMVRMTVDRHLRAWSQWAGIKPELCRARRFEQVIIEFKALSDGAETLSAAIDALGCRFDKHSKYVTGMVGG